MAHLLEELAHVFCLDHVVLITSSLLAWLDELFDEAGKLVPEVVEVLGNVELRIWAHIGRHVGKLLLVYVLEELCEQVVRDHFCLVYSASFSRILRLCSLRIVYRRRVCGSVQILTTCCDVECRVQGATLCLFLLILVDLAVEVVFQGFQILITILHGINQLFYPGKSLAAILARTKYLEEFITDDQIECWLVGTVALTIRLNAQARTCCLCWCLQCCSTCSLC